jgi:hypothetical protein
MTHYSMVDFDSLEITWSRLRACSLFIIHFAHDSTCLPKLSLHYAVRSFSLVMKHTFISHRLAFEGSFH